MCRTAFFLPFVIQAVPLAGAEVWTMPVFSADASAVYDAAQALKPPANADVFVIDLRVEVKVDETGRATRTRTAVLRVVSEAGARALSQIAEPWLAWRQNRPAIEARVITPDKQAHKLDPSTITEAGLPGANEIFTDLKLVQAPLPAVASGSVVETRIETSDREALIPGERFDRYNLDFPYPIHHFLAHLEAARGLHAVANGFARIDRRDSTAGGVAVIEFETSDIPKREPEPMLPPDMPLAPEIVYSTAASWQNVARWYAQQTESVIGVQVAGSAEQLDRIAGILADLQKKVRYTGLELGQASYIPRTPTETLTRGYGDCKDKATVLVSRLRAAGIPAKLALLTPWPNAEVLRDLPGLEAFNHVIVYVPAAHPLWIDPSAEYTPATRLPFPDQGRLALIVDPSASSLVRTPESPMADNGLDMEIAITFPHEGKASRTDVQSCFGGTEDAVRAVFAVLANSPAAKAKFEEQLKGMMGAGKVVDLEMGDPADLSKPCRIQYTLEDWKSGSSNTETALAYLPMDLTLFGGLLQLKDPKDQDKSDKEAGKLPRNVDYYVPLPMRSVMRYTVTPPAGFAMKQTPEVRRFDLGPVEFDTKIEEHPDKTAVVTYTLKIPKRHFTVAEARQIAAGLKDLRSSPSIRVTFTDEVGQLLRDGQDRNALDLARGRVKDAPQSAAALVRLASTLSAVGPNAKGIEIAKRAVALDPKSVLAWRTLASLYERDEFGRPFRRGMQYDAAVDALRHAIDLDPKGCEPQTGTRCALRTRRDGPTFHGTRSFSGCGGDSSRN